MPAATRRGTVPMMPDDEQRKSASVCAHCALEVPAGLFEPDEELQFCCNGCKTVYRVLQGAGLGGYYAVKEAVDSESLPASSTGRAYEELDDPAFQRSAVRGLPGGDVEIEFLLEGMHCAACVWLIERLPRVANGVVDARAHIRRRTVCVRFRPDEIALSGVAQKLDSLGYAVHPARGRDAREVRVREDRRFLIRVAVAGALAGNVMLLAIALYEGSLSGMSEFWQTTLRWYSMGLGLVVLIWPGRLFFRGAIAALRTRTAHLDLPIALALLVGGVWGVSNTLRGAGEIYFDSLSVLVFLLLVGRWVQHRQQRSASDAVELMLTLTPTNATVVDDDGTQRRVPIESVEIGMCVLVLAGDSIPVDGEVVEGSSSLDLSLLTGESRPVGVREGDRVLAGATNLSAPIRIRAEEIGESTRVGKLMKLISDASSARSPVVQFADRIAGRFVIIVVGMAMLTFGYWAVVSGVGVGIEHATALLIVTCPCALGLATPMAMSISMGRAARAGILIKDSSAIEILSRPGTMILDKTGTITEGRGRVISTLGEPGLIEMGAAVERHSTHPIAHAIVDASETNLIATQVTQTIGAGIRGVVDGTQILVGSPDFINEQDPGLDVQTEIAEVVANGQTPVVIHASGVGTLVVGIGDPIREGVGDAIQRLTTMGWDLHLCSGDYPSIVEQIAERSGIRSAMGGVTPEGKAALVDRFKRERPERRVVMVGDGVNDAAALASADVGIAVHGGAEASLEAADVYISEMGVFPLVGLVGLGSSTMRVIRLCFVVSIVYNIVALSLAMGGMINALIAAVLMPISSLTVIALCVRSWREELDCPSS